MCYRFIGGHLAVCNCYSANREFEAKQNRVIYVAPQYEMETFDNIARSMTEQIFANCKENEALKQMRDALLPKLMSGELDVSDIDI